MRLTTEGLLVLAKKYLELVPDLPRSYIEDKSKGSGLAKFIVCAQAAWFCIQCLARIVQNLGISLLELNVLGHAICALITCSCGGINRWTYKEPMPQVIVSENHAKFVVAMSVFGKFDASQLGSSYLRCVNGKFMFRFPADSPKKSGSGDPDGNLGIKTSRPGWMPVRPTKYWLDVQSTGELPDQATFEKDKLHLHETKYGFRLHNMKQVERRLPQFNDMDQDSQPKSATSVS
ncbi:hypothetical protein QBC34DRAFT_467878 [Podospora aff. communis PSN243]|uniref:Uncharacterized protein n=1 Tax=Podospora aff. communis PSN243 TaxID=3040156 RepID=A0AAV9GIM3_9PEZI|nr:hypothetical protein QBC34DRAFT_467878 [Podospora aff. communis PSN243]